MAGRSINAAGRRLSLDISAASRVNDERIKVWTTQNFNQQNGASPRPGFRNTDSSPRKLSLFLQRKQKPDGVKKVRSRKREVRQQTSETRLTCLEKFVTWRFVMVLLLQSSFMVTLFLRNTLPMSIVCMVRPRSSALTGRDRLSNASSEKNCSEMIGLEGHGLKNVSSNRNNTQHEDNYYEFDWDPEIQGLILTSIMFTSFLAPLLGTVMASRLGSKWSLTINNILSTVLTFFSPTAARISPYCLVVVRVLLGLLAGGNIAVVVDCVAWWAPQDEKLTMISLSFTGINIGNILASVLSGYLCLVPLDNGWPFVFYTFGAITLVWVLLWHFLSSQKPEDHPYISEKEKQYIVSHRVGMDVVSAGGKKAKPPYAKILKSRPSLAYISTGVCHIWVTQVLFTYLPMFFSKGLTFSVQDTGLLVSLTSLFRMLGTFFWTILGNKITSLLDVKRSRKICICIGFSVAGLSSIVVGFVEGHLKWVSTAVLICLMVCQSVGSSTITAVPLDMAPRYASLLNGLMVSTGSLLAISGPLLTAGIIEDGAHEKWRAVWIVMGVIFFIGATIFFLFGQATLQPYAMGKDSDTPHIVSPFVTMGRRFSTFIEAPPLSPVSPREGFNFTQNYQSPAATVLLATVSPEIFYPENLNITIPIDSNELDKETEGSVTTDEGERIDESESDVEITDEVNIPVRRRAFSEFGLEVLKSSTIHAEEDGNLNAGRNVFFKGSEVLGSKDGSSLKEADVEVNGAVINFSAGVANEAFTSDERKSSVDEVVDQVSRL